MEKKQPVINPIPQRSERRTGHRYWSWRLGAFTLALAALVISSTLLIGPDFGNARAGDEALARPATETAVPAEPREAGTKSEEEDATVVWLESLGAALVEAADKQVPVLVRFTASWCVPCQVMDARVWQVASVKAAIAERAVPVLIEVDEDVNADVVRRYGIRGVPTLLLVSENGEELARGGFMTAEEVVAFLGSGPIGVLASDMGRER